MTGEKFRLPLGAAACENNAPMAKSCLIVWLVGDPTKENEEMSGVIARDGRQPSLTIYIHSSQTLTMPH